MSKVFRSYLKNLIKFAITLALIVYLVDDGRLDFHQLMVVFDTPSIFFVMFGVWALGFGILASKRWQLLLKGIGVHVKYWEVVKLQLIGLFFNVAMPGSVGGDVVRGYYVVKKTGKDTKINAMLSIIVDRIMGLSSMFLLASIFLLLSSSNIMTFESSKELVYLVLIGLMTFIIFLVVVFSPIRSISKMIDLVLNLSIPGMGLVKKAVFAVRIYKNNPQYIVYALTLSVLIQGSNMLAMWYIAQVLSGSVIEVSSVAVVFPIGAVLSAIPISPGGLGVGHVAYERLFSLIGISGGANIFNVYILAFLFFNLFGGIFYILLKDEVSEAIEAQR